MMLRIIFCIITKNIKLDIKFMYKNIFIVADSTEKAQSLYSILSSKYDFVKEVKDADIILALGGDGFMLHTMHNFINYDIPIYGINCGSFGFLMNKYQDNNFLERVNKSSVSSISPLHMVAQDDNGKVHHALAMNEVSIVRTSRQAANLKICVDKKTRLEKLVADGILLSTPAGSTAYNLSVHGPILPLSCNLLALTPISPFRPRLWKGALLSHTSNTRIIVLNHEKRPVSVVADFTEIENVTSVQIRQDHSKSIKILFNSKQSLEERIIREQFRSGHNDLYI